MQPFVGQDYVSLKLTVQIGQNPKGNDRIPTIHFQVQTVSFREGKIKKHIYIYFCLKNGLEKWVFPIKHGGFPLQTGSFREDFGNHR